MQRNCAVRAPAYTNQQKTSPHHFKILALFTASSMVKKPYASFEMQCLMKTLLHDCRAAFAEQYAATAAFLYEYTGMSRTHYQDCGVKPRSDMTSIFTFTKAVLSLLHMRPFVGNLCVQRTGRSSRPQRRTSIYR